MRSSLLVETEHSVVSVPGTEGYAVVAMDRVGIVCEAAQSRRRRSTEAMAVSALKTKWMFAGGVLYGQCMQRPWVTNKRMLWRVIDDERAL